jgi:hypothetical protein
MRQLDHSMINVFIAGSNTPFVKLAMPRVVRLVMPRTTGHVVLAIVWGAALAGVALTLLPPSGTALGGRSRGALEAGDLTAEELREIPQPEGTQQVDAVGDRS